MPTITALISPWLWIAPCGLAAGTLMLWCWRAAVDVSAVQAEPDLSLLRAIERHDKQSAVPVPNHAGSVDRPTLRLATATGADWPW